MKYVIPMTLAAALAACGPEPEPSEGERLPPSPATEHDAPAYLTFQRDDLATAGLGIAGLRGAPPEPADPSGPTAEELRRLAIYTNYRALVDVTAEGGFGRLYGPDADDLPVPGTEYWALGELPGGASHVVIVQVPDGFPGKRPCLVAAPSSGSRGPYGAIGSAGDWALRRGCAVVYTDKGTGPWVTNLGDGKAFAITGVRDDADELDIVEPFSTREWPGIPDVAFKHAHSGSNPEAYWGEMVLDSIRFALERLGESHPGHRTYGNEDILVIAASVSNGGGAVLAAAEGDEAGLIDGVVASEPNVYVRLADRTEIVEGDEPVASMGRPLYDYATLAALYGPCAALAEDMGDAPMSGNLAMLNSFLAGRCQALSKLGLVGGEERAAQAASAYRAMLDHGIHPEAADAQPANTLINVWALVGSVYANAYGRFEPTDRVCGLGFRAFDAANQPTDVDPARAARLFGTSPGVPPVGGIDVAAIDGDKVSKLIFAPSETIGGPAYGLDQARCLRALWTADDARANRVREGVEATRLTGDLRGKPAIVVHGRSDGLVWINHSSRPYYAANQSLEGDGSALRFIEVTNAQHFDTLLGFPDFAARFVPLHLYFERALDRMYAHLASGASLPPSQVIHTTPRDGAGGGTSALSAAHVPEIADRNDAEVIQWQDGTLRIPR